VLNPVFLIFTMTTINEPIFLCSDVGYALFRCKSSILIIIELFLSQHWKHLCECSPEKHCLLYRHTLADLHDLVCDVSLASLPGDNVKQNTHLLNDVCVPSKKV
jgi:hypothetical protein